MNVLLQRPNAEKESALSHIEDQTDRSPVGLTDDSDIRPVCLLECPCQASRLIHLKSELALHREASIRTLMNDRRELFEGAVE